MVGPSRWHFGVSQWFLHRRSVHNYTRGKSHHSFLQDIIQVRLGNLNPCHSFCFSHTSCMKKVFV